jgi:hypothetical protein
VAGESPARGLIVLPTAIAYGELMRRKRYKDQIVVAKVYKVRTQPIWHASVFSNHLFWCSETRR